MNFKVLSCQEIEDKRYLLKEKHILISVSDPKSSDGQATPFPSSKRLATLYLIFHDWDGEHLRRFATDLKDDADKMVFFSADMARKILNFVREYENKVGLIVCQCEAGIRRSAGIAAGLAKILNGNDNYFFKHYIPNSLVYSQIIRAWSFSRGDSFDDIFK